MSPLLVLIPVAAVGGLLVWQHAHRPVPVPLYFAPLAGSVIAPALVQAAPRSIQNLAGYGVSAPDMYGRTNG